MTLTVRTLHTNGTITTSTEYAPRFRLRANALAYIGARLRAADATVAACRADEITKAGIIPSHTWVGHYNAAHHAVSVEHERTGRNNW